MRDKPEIAELLNIKTLMDLRRWVEGHPEGRNIDYKERINWKTAERCQRAEIIKDILAMANSIGGGLLILGIRDKGKEPVGLDSDCARNLDVMLPI